jgi:hypothetical protein
MMSNVDQPRRKVAAIAVRTPIINQPQNTVSGRTRIANPAQTSTLPATHRVALRPRPGITVIDASGVMMYVSTITAATMDVNQLTGIPTSVSAVPTGLPPLSERCS